MGGTLVCHSGRVVVRKLSKEVTQPVGGFMYGEEFGNGNQKLRLSQDSNAKALSCR